MLLILLVYGLLASRVRLRVFAALGGARGNAHLEARFLGMAFFRCMPLEGASAGRLFGNRHRRWIGMSDLIPVCRVECAFVSARVGLEDAAQTAMLVGALRAGALGAASLVFRKAEARCRVQIVPVFGTPHVCLAAGCIFSAPVGDIMFAAVRAALKTSWKTSGKEGITWKSIPLRA